MKNKRYSKEEIDYLFEIADRTGLTNKEIAEKINKKFNNNRTAGSIATTKNKLGIKSYTRIYTKKHIEYLRSIAKDRSHEEITNLFNLKFNEDRTKASLRGIMKSNGIANGRTGRFEKGQVPLNTLEVNEESAKNGDYLYVKISYPNIWKAKHRLIWEEHHGKIQDDDVIIFKDGNKRNFDIDNLEKISRKKLLTMNKENLIKGDRSLTETGLIIADIKLKIDELNKSNNK